MPSPVPRGVLAFAPLGCGLPTTPFKRVLPPSPPVFLPSPHPTLPRTTLTCPRALPSSCRPPETVRSTATASPSINSITVPPSPPSLVRTAARTHPSTFLPFSSPLTYPSLSLAYRSTPESSPALESRPPPSEHRRVGYSPPPHRHPTTSVSHATSHLAWCTSPIVVMPLYRRVIVFCFRFRYILNSNASLSMYLFCNLRIHVITLYSGHVYVYYASMLRC
jgi:hypothetical protein